MQASISWLYTYPELWYDLENQRIQLFSYIVIFQTNCILFSQIIHIKFEVSGDNSNISYAGITRSVPGQKLNYLVTSVFLGAKPI